MREVNQDARGVHGLNELLAKRRQAVVHGLFGLQVTHRVLNVVDQLDVEKILVVIFLEK